MTVRDTPWPVGTPCWTDLMARDRLASWEFYRSVFGWEIEDSGPETGNYGMAYVAGKAVAGLGTPPDPNQAPPPMWTTYLATDDLDGSLKTVTEHGGQIAVPAMQIGDSGRMAVAIDPTGAPFGMWQALDFVGTERVNEPGAMVWNQHLSRSPEQAREFYAAVFGYSYTPMPGGQTDYSTIDGAGPGSSVGGIGELDPSAPADAPQGWETYFMVADTDLATAAVQRAGGQVRVPPFDTPFGRMATVADPEGAVFSVMAANQEPAASGG